MSHKQNKLSSHFVQGKRTFFPLLHSFAVYALMIMKFGTVTELDVFYTMVIKNFEVTIST